MGVGVGMLGDSYRRLLLDALELHHCERGLGTWPLKEDGVESCQVGFNKMRIVE